MAFWAALSAITALASLLASIKQGQKAAKLQDKQRKMAELQAASEKVGAMNQERDERGGGDDFSQMLEAMVASGMKGEDLGSLISQPSQTQVTPFIQPQRGVTTTQPQQLGFQQGYGTQSLTPEMLELVRKYYGGMV